VEPTPLYFTYPSPFCYLAWQRTRLRPERYANVRLSWTPILFRRLMALTGGAAGGSPPLQLKYAYADAERWAKAYGVPFANFDRSAPADQTAHKVHLLAQDAGGGWEARWLQAAFTAGRIEGRDLTDATVVQALARQAGVPGLARLGEPELDARLEANTQRAMRDGVCGVPFLRHGGEAYWGNDRLSWLEARLAGKPHPEAL
jgi:2-hydroxychromene-2-carboxylate isomerase